MPASWQWRAMRRELAGFDHGAGGIGRARDDQPVELARPADEIERRLEPLGRARRQFDRHEVERGEDVAIGGIARRRQRHAVARLERREKGEDEARRRAGRDDHARGVDRDAVARRIMPGDRLAQRRQAERVGIAEHVASSARRAASSTPLGAGVEGWPTSRWSDVGAGRRALVGGAQHVHDDERRDPAAPRDLETHGGARFCDRCAIDHAPAMPEARPRQGVNPVAIAHNPHGALPRGGNG